MKPLITLIKTDLSIYKRIGEVRESSGVVSGCLLPRVFRESRGFDSF
jgi:hypothetical protein